MNKIIRKDPFESARIAILFSERIHGNQTENFRANEETSTA